MSKPIFISYHTEHYTQVLEKHLLPSLMELNLEYDIESIKGLGNWYDNTRYKATHILKMLLKHKRPVVFIDADAKIKLRPKLFFYLDDYDIGIHYLDWYKFWRDREGGDKMEALSGTLYLNYSYKVMGFLEDWIEENKGHKYDRTEQENMQTTLERWKSILKVYELPIEYSTIIKQDGTIPEYIKEPVIIHHQAGRIWRANLRHQKPTRQ